HSQNLHGNKRQQHQEQAEREASFSHCLLLKSETRLDKAAVNSRYSRRPPLIAIFKLHRRKSCEVISEAYHRAGEVRYSLKYQVGSGNMGVLKTIVRL